MAQHTQLINVANQINLYKDKNHKIISMNEEEAFDQLQPAFMGNILDNTGLEVKHLNTIKTVSEKP